jgi:hypothetical protein
MPKNKIKSKRMPYFEPEGMEENYKAERMPYMEPEGMEENYKAERMPYFEPEGLEGYVSESERRMIGNSMPRMQKGGMVRGQGIALRGTKFKGVF